MVSNKNSLRFFYDHSDIPWNHAFAKVQTKELSKVLKHWLENDERSSHTVNDCHCDHGHYEAILALAILDIHFTKTNILFLLASLPSWQRELREVDAKNCFLQCTQGVPDVFLRKIHNSQDGESCERQGCLFFRKNTSGIALLPLKRLMGTLLTYPLSEFTLRLTICNTNKSKSETILLP